MTALSFVSVPDRVLPPIFPWAQEGGKPATVFCCISQGLPSLIILGIPHRPLSQAVCAWHSLEPPSLGTRECSCSGQLYWHFESLMPPFPLVICLAFFQSYTVYLYLPHSSYSVSPSLPSQAPYASPFPPPGPRPWSSPVLPSRTFSNDVNVHSALSSVVAVSHMWLLST